MSERVKELLEPLAEGDRGALARCITLLESTRPADDADRNALLQGCDELSASRPTPSWRIAFTGAPGVGKSSLINRYGKLLVDAGHHVAVLAIDPSSDRTGGSILGDKTRMADLAREERAFIRPSPTSGYLGGTAERTREAMLVCEAAGFDRIIVETVGVGQSEHHVSRIVDAVVFLTIAGSGDGLQGIKRGILETVDLVAVNKADGTGLDPAKQHARELKGALELLRGQEAPACVTTSAVTNQGVTGLAEHIDRLLTGRQRDGSFLEKRQGQREQWFEAAIMDHLQRRLHGRPDWDTHHTALLKDVRHGQRTPYAAARDFLDRLGI